MSQQLVHLLPLLPSLRCLRDPHVLLTRGFASAVPSAWAADHPTWGRTLLSHRLAIEETWTPTGTVLGGPRAHAAEAVGT